MKTTLIIDGNYLLNKDVFVLYNIKSLHSDLLNLLKFDINEDYFNFMYNYKFSDERLYLPNNYNVYLYEKKRNANNLLFDMNQDDEYIEFIEGLIERTKVTTVSPEETLFIKCVHGDKGDNITSAYEKIGKTGKTMGIGLDGAKTIYRLYKETYNNEEIDFDSEVFIDKCAELISFSKKIEDENALDVIKKKLKRNRKLTKLTENYLPDYLLNEFNKINIK